MVWSLDISSVTLIGTPAKIDSSMAGRPSGVPGILMKLFSWRARADRRPAGSSPGCRRRAGRDLEGDPAVQLVGLLVDRPEHLGRAGDVGQGQLEEDVLRPRPLLAQLGDLLVVGVAGADRLVEDRGVGGLTGDVEVVDVALLRPVVEHGAGDVVEPEALSQVVELLRGLHRPSTSLAVSATLSGVKPNLVRTSFKGAEEPKVFIPIFLPAVRPSGPTQG